MLFIFEILLTANLTQSQLLVTFILHLLFLLFCWFLYFVFILYYCYTCLVLQRVSGTFLFCFKYYFIRFFLFFSFERPIRYRLFLNKNLFVFLIIFLLFVCGLCEVPFENFTSLHHFFWKKALFVIR